MVLRQFIYLYNKLPNSLHFKIPDSEARCSSCGNEPSSEDEWIMGTVATSFCKNFKATSFKLSYGPACKINYIVVQEPKKKILTKDSNHERENKTTNLSTQAFVVSEKMKAMIQWNDHMVDSLTDFKNK